MSHATTILIVDSDSATANRALGLLRSAGYEVVEARAGLDALDLLERRAFDLVLLRPELPDLAGAEVCRRIKSSPRLARQVVVYWSDRRAPQEGQDLESSLGADGYLSPSAEDASLLERLHSFVREQQARQKSRENVERLSTIVSTLHEITAAAPDPEAIMKLAVARAEEVTGADGAAMELVEGDDLVPRVATGILRPYSGLRSRIGASLASLCVRMDEVMRCQDVAASALADRAAYQLQGVSSVVMVPLRHQFNSVGVLKVVSTRPRAFDEPDIQALQMVVHFMATAINQVVALGAKQALLAEHSRTIVAFRESEARFRNAFDHAAIGMALMAVDGCWMKANQVLCRILGYDEEELRKLIFQTRVHPEDVAGYLVEADRLRAGEKGNFQMELRYLHKNGATLWILLSVSMLRDAMGDPLHLIAQIQDITEKKHAEEQVKISLREKDFLLKEIHHRVKNNLQVISSLLSLQSGYIRDGEILELFRESQNRVRSMALIHEKLYQSQDLGQIDFGEYVLNLVSMLFHSYRTHSGSVKLETRIDPVFLNIDTAIPVGLLINELVSNSLKYAFPAGRSGTIFIELRAEANQQFTLCFRDDGIGVPEEFDLDKTGTLGLRLVKILTSQIGGELAFHRNGGTQFVITFREQKDKDKQQSHGEPTSSGS